VRLIGRVQGVGLRATARHLAASRPLTGWVRNEPDESVTLEVQGSTRDVDAFLDELHERMSPNILDETAIDLPVDPEERSFEIRH